MMTTVLLAFLGLSTCTTALLVAAVILGARRGRIVHEMPEPQPVGELADNRGFAAA
jgi:hypothetical protein